MAIVPSNIKFQMVARFSGGEEVVVGAGEIPFTVVGEPVTVAAQQPASPVRTVLPVVVDTEVDAGKTAFRALDKYGETSVTVFADEEDFPLPIGLQRETADTLITWYSLDEAVAIRTALDQAITRAVAEL
jgi:hypothetical protein